MKLSTFKEKLSTVERLEFVLPDGQLVPTHFHVTEIGQITKQFIDCGGTVRSESKVNFQLWEAGDFDHRLAPQKLQSIIRLSEEAIQLQDAEIEVEYQSGTIGKYGLSFEDGRFNLEALHTNCLASDKCGIPPEKLTVVLQTAGEEKSSCCTPGSGCC